MEFPADVHTITCGRCGAPTRIDPERTTAPTAENPSGYAYTMCAAGCGWCGVYSFTPTRAQYAAEFGHPAPLTVLLDGDDPTEPVPVEQRFLPPGPWGRDRDHDPIDIPAAVWDEPCERRLNVPGRFGGQRPVCGGGLVPDPTDTFYFSEHNSTATVSVRCRRGCDSQFLTVTWVLTDEQHLAVFGRPWSEYRPEIDPDDYDDGEAPASVDYAMWRTADRGYYQEFNTLADLIGCQDWDLRAFEPGEFTVRHWPTGGEWDVPAFVADHRDAVDAEYADAEPVASGDYDEDTGEWIDDETAAGEG